MSAVTEPQRKALQFLRVANRATRKALGDHLYPDLSPRAAWNHADNLLATLFRMGLVQSAGPEHRGAMMLTDAGRKVAKS